MLHILLLILKIIGIVLLLILGIFLLLLLAVLLIPVRYRGEASFHGSIRGSVGVTWLLHLLSLRISYEGEPEITIRIFGKRVLSGSSEKDTEPEESGEVPEAERGEGEIRGPKEKAALEETDGEEMILSAQEMASDENESPPLTEEPPTGIPKPESKPKTKSRSVRWKQKLSSLYRRIRRRIRNGKEKLEQGQELYEKALEFLSREENQKSWKLLKRQLFKILHHLSPRKLCGEITVGLEDPYTMGQLVSAAAFLYPILQDRIRFTPIFGEKRLDGEISLRGRVRAGTLLWMAIRVVFDKNIRKLLKKILNRGGHKNGR